MQCPNLQHLSRKLAFRTKATRDDPIPSRSLCFRVLPNIGTSIHHARIQVISYSNSQSLKIQLAVHEYVALEQKNIVSFFLA